MKINTMLNHLVNIAILFCIILHFANASDATIDKLMVVMVTLSQDTLYLVKIVCTQNYNGNFVIRVMESLNSMT